MKSYKRFCAAMLILVAVFAVHSYCSADFAHPDDSMYYADADGAELNGNHGDETMKCISFVSNSYQRGDFLTAREKDAELSAIMDPSTTEIIDYIHEGILNMEYEIILEQFEIDPDVLNTCFQTLMNNYPDMYYLDMVYGYSVYNDGIVEAVEPYYTMSADEIAETQEQIDAEVENILAVTDPGMSRFDKIAAVNSYFASHYTYDYEHLNNNDGYIRHYTMPALFIDKKAVCQGFSLAFMYVMDKLDIPCTTAQSPPMVHMWNLVQAKEDSDNWYNIDVTWDTIYYYQYGMSAHTFFLKSDNRFQNMHDQDGFDRSQDHYEYQPDGWANDERLDDNPLENIGTKPCYSNGYWYYGKKKWDIDDSMTIFRYDSASDTVEAVVSVNDEWKITVNGSVRSYRGYCFNSVAAYDNKLYYNDALNIYVFDPVTGESKLFLSKPKGVVENVTPIFEIREENGNLIYVTAEDYPGNGVVVTEHSIRLNNAKVEYIGDVQVYETSVGISITGADGANSLIIAFYDEEGRFVGVDMMEYSSSAAAAYSGDIPEGAVLLHAFAVYINEDGGFVPIETAVERRIK